MGGESGNGGAGQAGGGTAGDGGVGGQSGSSGSDAGASGAGAGGAGDGGAAGSDAGQGGAGQGGDSGAGAGGDGGAGGSGAAGAGAGGDAGQGGSAGGASGTGGAGGTATLWSASEADDAGNIEALAATETAVYWVRKGKLYRAPVAGGAATELASGINSPKEMLADKEQLFVAEAAKISSCTLPDCKDMTALVTGIKPLALAVDATSMFWVEEGTSPDFTDGTVHRCGRFGCASPALMTPEKNEYRPGAVAAGEDSVFWINRGDLTTSNGLLERLDAGGPGGKGDELAKLLKAPSRLAYHGGRLFWMEEGLPAPLRSCQASSCAPAAALGKPSAYPIQGVRVLRADGDGIYWVNDTGSPLSSTAMRCPFPACTEAPTLLWEKLRSPGALATNSAFLFLGDASAGGTVYRVKKP
jgi:hypothetical protein